MAAGTELKTHLGPGLEYDPVTKLYQVATGTLSAIEVAQAAADTAGDAAAAAQSSADDAQAAADAAQATADTAVTNAATAQSAANAAQETANAAVPKSLYDANSIVIATADDTPIVLPVPAARTIARLASGDIIAATASQMRTMLALVVGTDVQAADADLTAIAALSTTSYGRSFLELANAAAARTLIGAVIGTDVQAYDSDLAAIAALSTTPFGRSLLTLADAAAATATLNALVGDSGSGGTKGLVPAPGSGDAAAGKFLKADGTFAVPTLGIYMPDAAPTSPNASNYEGGSVAAWTEWDFGSRTPAPANSNGHMELVYTNNSSGNFSGAYIGSPGGEFAFYAKILMVGANILAGSRVGLGVFQDGTSSSGDFAIAMRYQAASGNSGCFASTFTAYNGTETVLGSQTNMAPAYFRLRVNGAVVSFDVGMTGVDWVTIGSTTLGYTPLHIGPVVQSTTTNITAKMRFLRIFTGSGSSGFDATCIGREI